MTDCSTHFPPDADNSSSERYAPIVNIPLDLITPGEFQARRRFDTAGLDELAASIAESGVIQPVIVRGRPETGYTLLAGERRWRAAARANVHVVPAIVRNDLSAQQAAVLGLIENLQRESLGVIDTALGLHSLSETHNLTHDAIAERIGKSRVYVTNYLRVLKLSEPVQTLLDQGRLSLGHAKVLAGVNPASQEQLARRAAATGMSVRALEQAARRLAQAATTTRQEQSRDPALADLEQRLSAHLGNTVHIHYAPERRHGELRIDFHDLDEFDGLLARFGFDNNA